LKVYGSSYGFQVEIFHLEDVLEAAMQDGVLPRHVARRRVRLLQLRLPIEEGSYLRLIDFCITQL